MQNNQRVIEWIKHRFEPSEIAFNIFMMAFFAAISTIISLKIVGYNGVAMPYFWALVAVFGMFSIVYLLRIIVEPKDTRLDILTTKVDNLTDELKRENDHMTILISEIKCIRSDISKLSEDVINRNIVGRP